MLGFYYTRKNQARTKKIFTQLPHPNPKALKLKECTPEPIQKWSQAPRHKTLNSTKPSAHLAFRPAGSNVFQAMALGIEQAPVDEGAQQRVAGQALDRVTLAVLVNGGHVHNAIGDFGRAMAHHGGLGLRGDGARVTNVLREETAHAPEAAHGHGSRPSRFAATTPALPLVQHHMDSNMLRAPWLCQ